MDIRDFPVSMEPTVQFVIPLSSVNERLTLFLGTYENVCLKTDERCNLNLVVYGKEDHSVIEKRLSSLRKRYPSFVARLIPGEGAFSRARALEQGIATLSPDDLIFICDVDMIVKPEFLNRCRRNSIKGKQVYYPEVFRFYNTEYAYRYAGPLKSKRRSQITRESGHWGTYSYGMLCVYKEDFVKIGGFDTKIEGWGGEDIALADRVLKGGFMVMRAPDPALSHRYHDKVCSRKLRPRQFMDCISSRREDLADRSSLAEYVFYLEGRCKIKKWNLWSW